MTLERPNFQIGPRGHFCAGCDKQIFLHEGCVVDNSLKISRDDPVANASKIARIERFKSNSQEPEQTSFEPTDRKPKKNPQD